MKWPRVVENLNEPGGALWPCCCAANSRESAPVPCQMLFGDGDDDIRLVVGHVVAGVSEVFIELKTTRNVGGGST